MTTAHDDKARFEQELKALESQVMNVGGHMTIDADARAVYAREIKRMADTLRADALAGKITWAQAAMQAQQTRNAVMAVIRSRSTAVGRAMSQRIKPEGLPLAELIIRQSKRMYGDSTVFAHLAEIKQNAVYAAIVTSAGKSNPTVTKAMSRIAYAGRGLVFLSIGLSLYNVAAANDKVAAARKEVLASGASIAGGMAGGAVAGLACGSGAPVCVAAGAFIGGALAAFGVTSIW
ncbi:hypothetical protein GM668_23110 [Duganella ginsengisoli]|uniref:Uncharacterized protein n=2 Tax=Pseudoduganella ginsengisoli TaxID=1462440 RepID=A0A6L6Q5L3_9BURK|nr:hypothetical protein [Pseudoduganella ginsengisoli]